MPDAGTPTTLDWIFLIWFGLAAIISLHQAWANLVRRRISTFALDAVAVSLAMRFGKEAVKRRVAMATTNPKRLTFLGVTALLAGLAALLEIAEWLRGCC